MKIEFNQWQNINLSNLDGAVSGALDESIQLFTGFNPAPQDFSTSNNTRLTGNSNGYEFVVTGNHLTDDYPVSTITSLTLNDSALGETLKMSGSVSYNYNTDRYSGFYSSVSYQLNSINQSVEFAGKLNVDPFSADTTGGTATNIKIINEGYTFNVKGNLSVNADLDITAGKVTDLTIIDNAGHFIGFSGMSVNAAMLDQLLDPTLQINLSGLVNYINNNLSGNLTIESGIGSDALTGGNGNDILNGGLGADTLTGGKGNDTYIIDNIGDVVNELLNEGTDLVKASVSYTLSANVENLTLTDGSANGGTASLNGTGNALANNVTGNAGNNTLDGGAGADKLVGGNGDDTYIVDLVRTGTAAANYKIALQDIITETAVAGSGTDTVQLRLLAGTDYSVMANPPTLTLGTNLENLDASLTANIKLNLTGNALNNVLIGNDADNILDGGAGIDTLIGGKGNDTYLLDLKLQGSGAGATVIIEDSVSELNNTIDGIDTIKLRGSVALSGNTTLSLTGQSGEWINVENIDASATGLTKLDLEGNALDNTLIGNAAANTLVGGAGNDRLDGGAGADLMVGGTGNDVYIFDNIGDAIGYIGTVSNGFDEIISSANIFFAPLMPAAETIEKITLTGTANLNVNIRNAEFVSSIYGNAGNNILEGSYLGGDQLFGGKGNDTYIVGMHDAVFEQLTAAEGSGIDLVKANTDFTLGANIENLTLTDGTANGGTFPRNGTGNELKNIITGNAGSNILDGGAGVDKLIGGNGNDTYIVDLTRTGTTAANYKVALQDTITETAVAGSGIDTVQLRLLAGTDYSLMANATTLTLGANLENLDASLTGSTKLNLTGNALANTLTGNDANNILDGGAGIDILIGGDGDDTYMLDLKVSAGAIAIDDTIVETNGTGDGIDTIKLRGTSTLATPTTLILDNVRGWVNVEILDASATGSTKLNLTGNDNGNTLIGNAAANILTGGTGNDTLNGGAGADSMIGGDGNDTYIVDNIADVVTETSANQVTGGTDLVKASVSYTLGANVENLELTGIAAINGTGNADANVITGNTGNNILNGGAGIDTLIGGKGNDTYIVDNIGDVVTELLNEGTDLVKASVSYALAANVENLTLTDGSANGGTAALNGTGNALANTITGNAGNNILDGGAGVDRLIGGNGNDTYIVDLTRTGTTAANYKVALQDTITETAIAGSGIDTVQLRLLAGTDFSVLANATTLTLGANLENLDASLTGSTKLNLTGNALANTLTGNDANNILDGGAGNDILIGGLGSDTLKGGAGADVFQYFNTTDSTASSMDTILDFTQGVDKLDFSKLNLSHQLTFNGVSPLANSIWYEQISGNTYVYVDTDGNNSADLKVELKGTKNLDINDFIFSDATNTNHTAGQPVSEKFTVVSGNDYSFITPDSILLSDGRQLTSWTYVVPGSFTRQVLGQIHESHQGNSNNIILDSLGQRPSAAQLINGDLIVISESSGIQAQRFSTDGNLITGSFNINTYGASPGNPYGGGVQDQAKVAALSNGGYVVVWQSQDSVHPWYTENRPDNFEKGIYAKVFDANDQAITTEFKVNTYTNYDQMLPSIAPLERGGFIVCWQSAGQDNYTWGIYAQRFDEKGQLLGNEFQVNSTSAGQQINPVVSRLSENTLIAVWETEDAGTRNIYGRLMSSDGVMIGNDFKINDSTLNSATDDNSDAKLTVLSNGNFVVTWTSFNHSYDVIKGQVFTANGNKTGPEFTVADSATFFDHSVTSTENGGFTVTWIAGPTGNHIYSQQFYGSYGLVGDNNSNTLQLNETTESYTIFGLAGNDTLIGSDGDDTLDGGTGVDLLAGGKGNDTYYGKLVDDPSRAGYAKLEDSITELLNQGIDKLVLDSHSITNSNNNSFELPDNIENIDARAIDINQFKIIANNADNIIQSGKFYNEIYAQDGNDTIYINGIGSTVYTGRGNDTVHGSNGNNYIMDVQDYTLMGGNDTIFGYGGNDQIYALMGNDYIDGGDGDDVLYGGSYFVTYLIYPSIIAFTDNDIIYGGDGNDHIDGGAWGNDYLYGGDGNDTLLGGLTLQAAGYGGIGKAYIDGGRGNDTLYAMASDDTLVGGQGSDELTGGAGSDTFKWSITDILIQQGIEDRTDTVTDFSISDGDKLDLRDLLTGESSNNILNYLDISIQGSSTEIRISSTGGFGGGYDSQMEDTRIVLSNTNLFNATATSNETQLIGYLTQHNHLLIE